MTSLDAQSSTRGTDLVDVAAVRSRCRELHPCTPFNRGSIVLKENHYAPAEYRITQLDPSLQVEWSFKATNTESCERQPDGSLQCVSDHPNGFEWRVNAAAIDANGTVFVNSGDGGLYAIAQGGPRFVTDSCSSRLAPPYTPLAIGNDGLIYTQNLGHLFVAGREG